MCTLERAIIIAAEAHSGQVDKAGESYILHPLRLMLRMKTDEEGIVAVLHDVVEDSPWTLSLLRAEGFPEQVVQAIDSVTRRDDETYEAFVLRAGLDPIGRIVKLADLEDNCDLERIPSPTEKDHARVQRYHVAITQLKKQDRGAAF